MWAFLYFLAPFKSWTFSDDGSYISLAHSWFSLFLAMLYCYSCRNNLILLGLFWASRLFLLSVACHGHCFAFTYGLLCPFRLSFRHPRPDRFLWASSTHLLISHSHELFITSLGFPGSITLFLSLGFMGLP